jgi:tetratricopeptide (TPR) repeat protein
MVCKKKIRLKQNEMKNLINSRQCHSNVLTMDKNELLNTNIFFNMKTKITIVFALIVGMLSATAQNAADCTEKLSIFNELCKAKDFSGAYEPWLYTRKNCATFHEAIYLRGEQILNYRIDNAKSVAEKEKEVRDLIALFNEHDKNYPTNGKANGVKKALALYENNVGTADEVYAFLDGAFKNDKDNFSNAKALYLYFEMFVNDFEAGKKNIQLQSVFDMYDKISDKIEEEEKGISESLDELIKKEDSSPLSDKENRYKSNYQINLEAFETVRTSMDAKISLLATCERLIPFLSASFDAKKGDAEWLRRAADRLDKKGCSSDPLFGKISDALHILNPTAQSAYNLGVTAYNRKNISKALEYFNQSADLQTDSNKKANVYYTIARNVYGNSNKSQARAYAEKALSVKPSFGEAHVFIAQLYANSVNEAATDPFDKRAVYWLAAQTARRAGTTAGNNLASAYEKSAPSRSEIFSAGKQGQQICFRSWIGKCVTVPNL